VNAAKKPPTLREAARALLDTVNQTCLAHPVPHLSYPIDTLERALAADEARGVCANPYCPHEASAPPAGEPVTCRCVDRATLASSDCQTWDGSVLHSQAGCYEVSAFRSPMAPAATIPCSCGGYAGEYHRPGEPCFPPAATAQRYRIDYERCTRWVPRPDTYGVGRALARLERVSRGGGK
jgi:hypothetical protein